MRKSIVLSLLLASFLKPGPAAATGHDILLGSPYAVKAAIPLVFVPATVYGGFPIAAEAALLAGVTLPNSMVLADAAIGNAEGVGFWRRVAFWSDAGLAAAAAGLSCYALSNAVFGFHEDSGFSGLASAVYLAGAAQMALFAYWDTKPFDLEKRAGIGLSGGLIPTRSGLGLAIGMTHSF